MFNNKPKVAFFDFTGCEGCQLTVIDTLETHPGILDAIEIVQFREAMSEKDDNYLIAFVEGACTRPNAEERLRTIREQAEIVVALGACAHLGGVNAVLNRQDPDDARSYVYGETDNLCESYAPRPTEAVIPIDAFIPGCPIDRREFIHALTRLLQGREPDIPDYPVCMECKLKENGCLLQRGEVCLGSVVRAGCGAICPSFGMGCAGCRGLISNPNLVGLHTLLAENGLREGEISNSLGLFMTCQITKNKVGDYGN